MSITPSLPDLDEPGVPHEEDAQAALVHAMGQLGADVVASPLVRALEAAWAAIRKRHPGVPPVVIVLGSGVERGSHTKHGHFHGGAGWRVDHTGRPEVLIAGESLSRSAEDIFATLLHEAVHALNHAREVSDTTRGGRYHNRKFASAARELGFAVEDMPPHGMARTVLTPDLIDEYQGAIGDIHAELRISRDAPETGRARTRSGAGGRPVTVVCACKPARRLQVYPATSACGPITCGVCGSEFTAPGAESARA